MGTTLPVDPIELGAAGQAATPGSGHRLRGQSLALLVAAALQDESPGLRLHPLAEAVGASPLALLGLIRALHAKAESSPRPITRISALVAGALVTPAQPAARPDVCCPSPRAAGPHRGWSRSPLSAPSL